MAETKFTLVANNGFTVQDNPEPEVWVRPLVEAGMTHLEYFADHMDPLFYENVIREKSEFYRATVDTIAAHDISTLCVTTGRLSYLTNGLSHPYADVRREALRWCEGMAKLASALGAKYIGGHYDYISQTELATKSAEAEKRLLDTLLRMAEGCAKHGIDSIFLEQMYIPNLKPYTIEEGRRFLAWLNERAAVPFNMQIDTGHMALASKDDPAHTDRDKDPYAWLSERYPQSNMYWIHAQQTEREKTHHWPFTEERNRMGFISPERLIESTAASEVDEAFVSFEILYPRGTAMDVIARDLAESAQTFRKAFEKCGYAGKGDVYTKKSC